MATTGDIENSRLLEQCQLLRDIFTSGSIVDDEGQPIGTQGGLSLAHAEALYESILWQRPKTVIEIGLAYGISTLAILAALHQIGEGELISLDPAQHDWRNIGLSHVRRAGYGAFHRFVCSYDYEALPELLHADTRIQAAYVDGWHTLDYVLVDIFYIDKMLDVAGIIGFNDCGYPAVNTAIRYLQRYRRYREIDVGLSPNFTARNVVLSTARRALRWGSQDRYFQKTESWEPPFNFYTRIELP